MAIRPFVSVVVPAKNEEKYIGECLDSLLNQSLSSDSFEIIVVDNLSTDNTSIIAQSKGVTVLKSSASTIGAVRNVGAMACKGEMICFIDADCIAGKEWLALSVDEVFTNEDLVIGGDPLPTETGTWVEKCWAIPKRHRYDEHFTLCGASMAFSKKAYNAVNGFNENVNSNEDTLFSNDIRRAGFSVEWRRCANVVHNGYPQTLVEFFIRQLWQSSSYLKTGILNKDRVFLFVISFVFGLNFIFVSFFILNFCLFFLGVGAVVIGPFLFSLNKLAHSESVPKKRWFMVFILSLVYFLGRSIGLIYSVTGRGFNRKSS